MNIAKLAHKLTKKLGNTIKYRLFIDIFDIINNYIYEQIINDQPIYIDKLGVITQMVPKSKRAWSRRLQKHVMTKPTKKLVFRPHSTFTRLIKQKREVLKIPGNISKSGKISKITP